MHWNIDWVNPLPPLTTASEAQLVTSARTASNWRVPNFAGVIAKQCFVLFEDYAEPG